MPKINFSMFPTKFNLIFPTIIFFLVLFLPFLYSQQDFLLSISPIFLNPSILYTSFIVFLFTNIYFIQVKNNTWASLFFTFFIIFYSFLAQNAQNNLAKNVYLGNCQGEYIYKKSEYTSGRIIQGSEPLYSFFSSDWNMSIVKSKEFGLQKVAIYGIQEDWLSQKEAIKYKYNDQNFLQELDTWIIFERPHSTARSADFEDENSLKKLDKSEFANCPELGSFIEKQYNLILTSQTLQKIKAEYTIQKNLGRQNQLTKAKN